uniref:Reverse transcriptase zinc-binding domain-containing protein n=1 Tax=Chenopodium quinoa TaxID=63459 RepID=A0A803L9W5_CHEQI
MFWWPSNDGAYTVRSGYWLCKKVPAVLQGVDMNEVWRLIWSMKCPPKLQHFLWRACKGFLAVKERLHYRHITPEKSCSICNASEESINHAIFECKAATEVWAASPLFSQVSAAPSNSFVERFLWYSKNVSKDELLSIASLAWAAWHCRNKYIFEQEAFNAVDVARGWVKYVKESLEYAVRTGIKSALCCV